MKSDDKKFYIIAGIIAAILVGIIVIGFITNKTPEENNELSYTDTIKKISDNSLEKIEMTVGSTSITAYLRDDETKHKVIVPSTQAFMELVQNKVEEGSEIELIQNPQSVFVKISSSLFALLPTIMIVILFILIFQMQGLGNKSRVYGVEGEETDITFDDVAGLDEEKAELVEVVDFLKNPKDYNDMGAKIPRGILLCGKPGTGKTLIAKAIAGEANVPFISMNGSEFSEIFAGLGASRVRKLFDRAKKLSPCIIFIDEIDAVGSKRTVGGAVETDNNQTLNQLLVEMDGFETDETVIVLAATNRPEMLDKALLRPGRFDRQINIATPDLRGREEILKIHAKNKKLSDDLSLKSIAEDTAGFTGAELANVLNESAIIATKHKHETITKSDLDEAVKKVTVGLEKTSRVISDKDKKLTAYHEAGHAVVSKYLTTQLEVKEVSIIPRGVAGGYTMYRTDEDKFYISKTEMKERLISLLGGRAGEKLALNDISTGASNDIKIATQMARDMVTVYGMSDTLGPICLDKEEREYELLPFGENINDSVGIEVKKLIDEAYSSAQAILSENMAILHTIANTLLEKEKISEEEFNKFFE